MHNNYYFLKHLSYQLKNEMVGFIVAEIYSQVKNELVISLFNKEKEIFIKSHLDPFFCCLSFPEKLNRSKRNSANIFQRIINHQILDVVQIDQDRSFYLKLSNDFQLLFKMHGNRSNIILFQKGRAIELFKNQLKPDFNINISDLSKSIIIDENEFSLVEGSYKKLIPTFGNSFDGYFENKIYNQLNLKEKYKCLMTLLTNLKKPEFFVHINDRGFPMLKLYKSSDNDLKFNTSVAALNYFYKKYISTYSLEKGKTTLRNSLNKEIKKGGSYIKKSSTRLELLGSSTNYRNIGDLIMANLQKIKPYSTNIELQDFYSEKSIPIPLKSSLTPQLNAEKYYRKAKNQQIEIDTLKKNISLRASQVASLKKQVEELNQISKFKELAKSVIKKPLKKESPFHKVILMDYEILIGKNAKKNELLTFGIARKDDLFLHAKDASGSHVIIKKKTNQNIPIMVIEKAASYAAFYSKNKSESLSRVLYTPKKYVRKAKGAPQGAVIIDRENVILVSPQKIDIPLFT